MAHRGRGEQRGGTGGVGCPVTHRGRGEQRGGTGGVGCPVAHRGRGEQRGGGIRAVPYDTRVTECVRSDPVAMTSIAEEWISCQICMCSLSDSIGTFVSDMEPEN